MEAYLVALPEEMLADLRCDSHNSTVTVYVTQMDTMLAVGSDYGCENRSMAPAKDFPMIHLALILQICMTFLLPTLAKGAHA